MKKIFVSILIFFSIVGVALASPVSVDRLEGTHIEPLVKTDFIQASYFKATSTTQASLFQKASSTLFSSSGNAYIGGTLFVPLRNDQTLPALTVQNDSNTGLDWSNSDVLNIVAGGSKMIRVNGSAGGDMRFNDSGIDVDYKFKNSSSNSILTMDSGNSRIGINTGSTPGNIKNALDVNGAVVIGASYAETNTAPTNGLLVQGNVGIGTTSPLAKLSVVGQRGLDVHSTESTESGSGTIGGLNYFYDTGSVNYLTVDTLTGTNNGNIYPLVEYTGGGTAGSPAAPPIYFGWNFNNRETGQRDAYFTTAADTGNVFGLGAGTVYLDFLENSAPSTLFRTRNFYATNNIWADNNIWANNRIGAGTSAPDAKVHAVGSRTIGNVSNQLAVENLVGSSNYFMGDTLQYLIYATDGTIYSQVGAETGVVTITLDTLGVDITFDAVAGATGYRIFRNFNGSGYVDYYDTGSTFVTDDNCGGLCWTSGTNPPTPTTQTTQSRMGYASSTNLYGLQADGKVLIGSFLPDDTGASLSVTDNSSNGEKRLAFFETKQNTERGEFTLANSGDGSWTYNFLSIMNHGSAYPNNFYTSHDAGSSIFLLQGANAYQMAFDTYNGQPIGFYVGNTKKLELTTGGVNITAPLKFNGAAGTSGQIPVSDGSSNPVWTTKTFSQWITSGSNIYYDGNVGVSTSTPWGKLSVGTHNLSITSPAFVIASSSTSVATTTQFIVTNGNVGVGTSSPAGRFSVQGDSAASATKGTCFRAKDVGANTFTYWWYKAGVQTVQTNSCSGSGTTTITYD